MLSVPMQSNKAQSLYEAIAIPGTFLEGSAKVECDQPVAMIGLYSELREDGRLITFTTLPPAVVDPTMPSSDETAKNFHVLPHIADGGGWQSILLVTNVSPSASPCTLQLYGGLDVERFEAAGGVTAAASMAAFELPASGGNLVWRTRNELAVASGYATLDCVNPVVAQVLFARVGGGMRPTAMATVFSSPAATGFQFPVLTPAATLGFAIANDANSEASCRIRLVDPQGTILGEAMLSVPVLSNKAQSLYEAIAIPGTFLEGSAKVQCDQPVVMIGLYSELREDGGLITFTTLPPAVIDDGHSVASGRSALEALYEATDGPNWVNNDNWLTDAPLGEWYGVDTNESGRVTSLNLPGNGLSGTIPPVLGQLASLERLELGNNQLSGAIPTDLGNLANLQWLSLGANRLSGSIPSQLGNLANLRRLFLDINPDLTGKIPQSLMQLSQLELLFIAGTRICVPTTAAFQAWLATISQFWSSGLACDGSLRISFLASSYEVREGESVEVTVRMIDQTEGPARSATISLVATPGGGATGADYSGVPGRVAITAPASEETFLITAVKDSHYDNLETITLSFRRPLPSGVTAVSPDTATVTIIDPGTAEVTDREVLEALYEATGGPAWIDRSNWLSTAPLGEWLGVDTDGNGRVTSLNLPGNGLSGTIPPVLGRLASLERLVLGSRWDSTARKSFNNRLTGTLPPELGNLENLQGLDLSNNQLSGSISIELGALSNLRGLDLSNNQLSGPIPTQLGALENLEVLKLRGNRLSGLIPTQVGNLENLYLLELHRNRLSGPIPARLGALENLQWLNLGANQLNGPIPAQLGSLDNLQELSLYNNQLGGSIPTELANLSKLRWLDLGSNRLTGPIPTQLGNLDNLVSLYLYYNQLSGPIPAQLRNLDNLMVLALRGNQLSGPVPAQLGDLVNLEWLDLSRNQLTGPIPAQLGDLVNLQRLLLDFNPDLTGTIPPGLRQLPLVTLYLMATSVCVPEDAELRNWLEAIENFLPSGLTCGRRPDEMPTIDVAVFYTPGARRQAGGNAEVETMIDLWVAETNQAYQDSGVNQEIGLAAREEVDYEVENRNRALALDRLRDSADGYMDEVHEIRDRTGADLVHLIADGTGPAGIANTPGAFGVTCASCDSSTFAHELGHNMGLWHDRYVDGGSGDLPFSHGYVNQRAFTASAPEPSRWLTIMAYNLQCDDAGFSCDSIMRFSNPNQTWLGDPLGVSGGQRTQAVDGPADAARTLNLTRHSVADFRPRASGNPLTISSTRPPSRSLARTGQAPALLPGGGLFRPLAVSSARAALQEDGGVLDQATLRHRKVSVDTGRLDGVPDGGNTALRLNLFEDVILTGIIQRRTPTYSGGYALSGPVYGVPGGRVTLVVNGNLAAGTVRIPGATFRIRPAGGGGHSIVQLDPSQLSWLCGTEP